MFKMYLKLFRMCCLECDYTTSCLKCEKSYILSNDKKECLTCSRPGFYLSSDGNCL